LLEGVTVEKLQEGHISVLRNPDISHVLYLRGLMEKAGRGSVLMIQQCRDNGLADPEWKSEEKLGVTVTFRAPQVTPQVKMETVQPLKMTGLGHSFLYDADSNRVLWSSCRD
jgi:ATP-dependent DNA helicase RecG